jgi:hypothetical protein
MHRPTHAPSHSRVASGAPGSRPLRALRTPRPEGDLDSAELDESSVSLRSPDDVSIEIEDLASHFLWEATQSDMPNATPAALPDASGADAALREAFFEETGRERDRLREFERIWKHIISRELVSTEL